MPLFKPKKPSAPKSAADWLSAAMIAFTEAGPDGVRIEPLARRMGVSKGSFYWHFRNRDHLITDMIAAWEQAAHTDFVTRVDLGGCSARHKLARFIDAVSARGPSAVDRQMRAFAGSNLMAAEAVRRIDISREHYIEQQLMGCGVSEAQALSFTIYAACLGMMLASDGRAPEDRRELLRTALDMSIGPLPKVA